jgi:alanyl-tRNA synthetase
MPPTERLYYADSHLIEFEARVIDKTERVSSWTAVILDRTAFYPTGGGQPSDTGTLDGARVVECIDDGDNGVLHVTQGALLEVGSMVKGRVDWPRRFDHIQQHTGQHILSQAFVTLFKAATHSFRVLDHSCEIDVELANPSAEIIEKAVSLANNVIWEDRPLTIRQVTAQQAADLTLRKESTREGELRLIEIEGFDLTPCGGTHAYRTGEVGMIAVRSWERAKGLVRIEFVAGRRALDDYRVANKTARNVAALFSAGRDDTVPLVKRVLEENKDLHRRMRGLEEIASRVQAEELLANVPPGASGVRVVSHIAEHLDGEHLKRVAVALIARPKTIALLGSRYENTARIVFARSADLTDNMNQLVRDACVLLDGRGGGRPELAEGGGSNVKNLGLAIEVARQSLSQQEPEPNSQPTQPTG